MDLSPATRRLVRPAGAAALIAALAVLVLPRLAAAQAATDSTTLLWTAPGDDGTVGRASTYSLRYRTAAIAGTDTLSWWNAAASVTNMPLPGVTGVTDSVVVRALDPTKTYYFILRTADEVPNWSGFSNLAVKLPRADTIPPAAVTDLRGAPPAPAISRPANPARARPGGGR